MTKAVYLFQLSQEAWIPGFVFLKNSPVVLKILVFFLETLEILFWTLRCQGSRFSILKYFLVQKD